jgi:uncharacterized protein (DUF924 family)
MTSAGEQNGSMTAAEILRFWFDESSPAQWWAKSEAFDRLVESRFGALHAAAICGELYAWRQAAAGADAADAAAGRLAEVMVLDQFSRNIFRDRPEAFAPTAWRWCWPRKRSPAAWTACCRRRAVLFSTCRTCTASRAVCTSRRCSCSLPREWPGNLDFELPAQAIIDRFGRYPHRNAILGRPSTAAEIEFLKTPGSAF